MTALLPGVAAKGNKLIPWGEKRLARLGDASPVRVFFAPYKIYWTFAIQTSPPLLPSRLCTLEPQVFSIPTSVSYPKMTHTSNATTISSRPLAIQVGQLRVRLYAVFFRPLVSNAEFFLVIDSRLHLPGPVDRSRGP